MQMIFSNLLKSIALHLGFIKDNKQEININTMETQETKKRNVIVCLDNGHGKDTPGKGSPWSLHKVAPELPFKEYEYCRKVVMDLKDKLEKDGYEVYVVTPEDNDIKLEVRSKRINNIVTEGVKTGKHVLSISVHNNAAGSGSKWYNAYGWSVWTTPGQTNSDILAQCLYDAAEEILFQLGQKTRKDMKDGDADYEDNFAMCRIPKCPAVLTENMFQDCIEEVKFLTSLEGFNAIVDIHHKGINKFVNKMGW